MISASLDIYHHYRRSIFMVIWKQATKQTWLDLFRNHEGAAYSPLSPVSPSGEGYGYLG